MNPIRQPIIMIEHIIASISTNSRADDEISSPVSIKPVATTSGMQRHIAVIVKTFIVNQLLRIIL